MLLLLWVGYRRKECGWFLGYRRDGIISWKAYKNIETGCLEIMCFWDSILILLPKQDINEQTLAISKENK
jgi:hypothetical protein